MVRALASNQRGPGSNPGIDAICGLSLLSVLSFAPRGFSPGTLVFLSPQKPTFPNSSSTRNQADEELLCRCATSKSLFLFYFFLFNISCLEYTASICIYMNKPVHVHRRSLHFRLRHMNSHAVVPCFCFHILNLELSKF